METLQVLGEQLWERMNRSVKTIEERLRRTVEVLKRAEVPYAVIGGNAVRIWVAQVDKAAVRATNDVDVLIRPGDLAKMKQAMQDAGFIYRQTAGLNMFVEHADDSVRDAVHVVLSGEKVRQGDYEASPDVDRYEYGGEFRTLPLELLVRMKLNSFRLKDKVHLLDMIDVGLIDGTWLDRYPEELRRRLKDLIDNPDQ